MKQIALEIITFTAGQRHSRSAAGRSHAAKVGRRKSAKNRQARDLQSKARECEAREIVQPGTNKPGVFVLDTGLGHDVKNSHSLDPNGGPYSSSSGEDTADSPDSVEDIPRTLSPIFGAATFTTFNPVCDTAAVQVSDLMGRVIWPVVANESASSSWFGDFCNVPMLFHAHCLTACIYRDLLAGSRLWSSSSDALQHKAATLSLMQDQFSRRATMSNSAIEQLIFAMLILGSHEFEPRHFKELILPFVPHLPTANWIQFWGRMDPVVAHDAAAFALIMKQGGLQALTSPGLGYIAALVDLVRACSSIQRPVFPCLWTSHVTDILPRLRWATSQGNNHESTGHGFAAIPNGLPKPARSVFKELACFDSLMASFCDDCITVVDTDSLLDARNATLHRLLSLPTWDDLEDKENSYRATYEVCRITCVIYANAAIIPLPPHNGWNERLAEELVSILQMASFEMWDVNVSALYIWALVIGGMAAFGTRYRHCFEDALRTFAVKERLTWEIVHSTVKGFVWSDSVCEVGAYMLWSSSIHSN